MEKNLVYLNEWEIKENRFVEEWLNNYEAVMSQGNGYLGIRAVTEESYVGEIRNFFVAGTFNQFSDKEVSELPNIPDPIQMDIYIDKEKLDLSRGKVTGYQRCFNFETGELFREFTWTSATGKRAYFSFKRCVSMEKLHFIKQEIQIKPLDEQLTITVSSGIDGRVTNSGTQHFDELQKRKKKDILQMGVKTINSGVEMIISTKHKVYKNGQEFLVEKMPEIPRRQIKETFSLPVSKEEILTVEKTSSVFTSRDFDLAKNIDIEEQATKAMEEMKDRYEEFLIQSKKKWQEIYAQAEVKIHCEDFMDQLLLNFSRYHMHIMTHPSDNRVNIGAKGLSGEGYKGHTFWDTDIFILPYFIYGYPEIAQNLVEYRYKMLAGARKKANNNYYLGAQMPWECAWIEDGETTPYYGEVDIITGEQTKILTGLIEDHVSSDVIFGYKQFLDVTGRKEKRMEYAQLVLETALFWTSRAVRNSEGQFEILDVIGPDEYKEHVDNNTYTNRMAKFNVDEALDILSEISDDDYALFKPYLNDFSREDLQQRLQDFSENIFIHQFNSEGILPQDDDYLTKKEVNISNYKKSEHVNEIFKEYNLAQVNNLQVSKQADIVLLLTNFFDEFSAEDIERNFDYYEARTLHDSSLSLSTHSLLASLLDKKELAYEFFQSLRNIDLGENMFSSVHGIHSASMGGVWQAVVFGFGGFRYDAEHDKIHIDPKLPDSWQGLDYQINFRGQKLAVSINKKEFLVELVGGDSQPVVFYTGGVKFKTGVKIEI